MNDARRAMVVLCVMAWGSAQGAERVDFERDVQPILKQFCMECHGAKRKGGLDLTYRASALREVDSGRRALVPGSIEHSVLMQRITTEDSELRMPPKGDRPTTEQIGTIRRWIKEGLDWSGEVEKKHWAYVAPVRPALPEVKHASLIRNPIDRFVLAQLESHGLTPMPPVDRARLLRRVSLDLTGLPPSIEAVEAFERDTQANAYEKAVDRLLASPRYGEHWAQAWLDLARYADSNGFQADQIRDSWAYRDWVVRALNADMPFDQFTIEQLAGDLLPDATVDQRIATGFHRTVTCNVEAGVHPEENRVNQVVDRVNTTGTVWLGTTLECAQCHGHKYDPFTQSEYYGIFAFFNQTPLEVKQTAGVTFDFYGPKMSLPLPEARRVERERLVREREALQQEMKARFGDPIEVRSAWESRMTRALKSDRSWHPVEVLSVQTTGGESSEILDDGSVLIGGILPGTSVYTVVAKSDRKSMTGIRLETLTHPSLPGKGPGRGDAERTNFILNEFEVALGRGDDARSVALHAARSDFSQDRWDVRGAIDGDRKTGWAIAPEFHKSHWASFETELPLVAEADQATVLTFTLDQNYGRGRTIGRFRLSVTSGDQEAAALPTEVVEALQAEKRTKAMRQAIDAYYKTVKPGDPVLDKKLEDLDRRINRIEPATTLVMVEMDEMRPTHLMRRGDYLNPGPVVEAGTPQILHAWRPQWPKNRLGFARWLVDRDNPLVGRVTVNRWWAQLMGRPLVSTPEDFGSQSDAPSHPALLDWLATEFVTPQESGAAPWSMKHIHKLIVMSATYQRSSRVSPEDLGRDPENQWYARGARFRLSAESIRDNALAISGLLSTQMGGEPVMPYQPEGIWRSIGRNQPKWVNATTQDRFRRGLYVVWKRAAPYPSFVTFDAPDRSACVPYRARTNTPLQALALLNDPAYVEMALALAMRLMTEKEDASDAQRVDHLFRLALARHPSPAEAGLLKRMVEEESRRLVSDPKSAHSLVKGIESHKGVRVPAEMDRVALAVWFRVASVLLNLDETMTRG